MNNNNYNSNNGINNNIDNNNIYNGGIYNSSSSQRYNTPDIIGRGNIGSNSYNLFNGKNNFVNKMMFSNWNNTYKL